MSSPIAFSPIGVLAEILDVISAFPSKLQDISTFCDIIRHYKCIFVTFCLLSYDLEAKL